MTLHSSNIYDQLLLTAARAGNARAADRLAARWAPRLLRTARRLLRDEELAHEAAQEAWLGICRGWMQLRDPAKFPAWAFGILHRKSTDIVRRRIKERAHFIDNSEEIEASSYAALDERAALRQAFLALKEDHRITAVLFFGEGLSLAEIAEVTAVPLGTAKSRLFHARRLLKAALSEEVSHD